MENTLLLLSSRCIMEFEISITLEKQILVCKSSPHPSLMADDKRELKLIICSHKKKLEFTQIPIKISFNINLYGFCASTMARLESRCLIAK